ncbi:uncharacterized protein LOC135193398 [Vanessa tameamea]|uniref:Uncharacterized protein LOC135193398 n=1 Tax=Vanessa tameamea TaxID=334116 RepID=A0ABM4AKG4_VANTA
MEEHTCAARGGGAGRRVRGAACGALAAAAAHRCVRCALAATKDCLYNLLVTLTPINEEEKDVDCIYARAQALHLLAALLSERAASDTVWWELKKNNLMLFHLLLQALESDDLELQEAAMHCLTQLARSLSHNNCNDKSKDQCHVDFFNDFPSPHAREADDRLCAGDGARNDCQPEYIVEEFCKIMMNMYQDLTDKKKCLSSQDETWSLVCSCLCSLQRASGRARAYCVHRRFPRALVGALQSLRDALSLRGKPVDVIKNADHEPTFNSLNWVLTLVTCSMFECPPAKNLFAEDLALSLIRLWPWCMMTESLRDSLMSLLITFTNDFSRAWSSMCSCVGGRSLLNEVCSLVNREASRPRPTSLLQRALRILRHCAPHQHCRTIIIKNDILSRMNKVSGRRGCAPDEWCRLGEALARHAEGAAALLAGARAAPARLLPALAHAAHHQRLAFLQSPDLLDLLSSSLLTGDTSEIVSAARAVWALAANNHRAKLVLRSAGMPVAVQSSLHRLQKNASDEATKRAIQLLTYTQTVLQAT